VPGIIEELTRLIDPAGSTPEARQLWVSTALMTGLRFPWSMIEVWFGGITSMRESSVYVQFVKEGSIFEARKLILRMGQIRFGIPEAGTRARVEAITDLDRLEYLAEKLLTASDWDDLLEES
jgi:hypothetical protein